MHSLFVHKVLEEDSTALIANWKRLLKASSHEWLTGIRGEFILSATLLSRLHH